MNSRSAPPPGTLLCPLDDIDDPGAKGFSFGKGAARFGMFLVRKDNEVHAYVNACPHAGTRLDHWPDRFLTLDETRIICAAHAALFEIESGVCTSGPCVGKGLTAIPIEVVGGTICIATGNEENV